MKKRTKNILVMMLLSMTASLMAMAQTTQQKHPAEPPAPSIKQLPPGNGAGFSADSSGTNAEAGWNYGWNYVHPQYCETYYSGGYYYYYVHTYEGGYFYTTDTVFQAAIHPACQTGNWIAIWIYDNSNNYWNRVWTYTYK